jgi:hypothetical protein
MFWKNKNQLSGWVYKKPDNKVLDFTSTLIILFEKIQKFSMSLSDQETLNMLSKITEVLKGYESKTK